MFCYNQYQYQQLEQQNVHNTLCNLDSLTSPCPIVEATTSTKVNKRHRSKSIITDDEDEDSEGKRSKRRRQLASASRTARARKKRELEELREENKRLKEKKSQIIKELGELRDMVQQLKQEEEFQLKAENESLKEQIEDHIRLVNLFKCLCDGAPKLTNGKHVICKQGSDEAQSHLLNLLFQSQTEEWKEALLPMYLNMFNPRFAMYYKYEMEDAKEGEDGFGRRRLSVRIDTVYPSTDATNVSEFFWDHLANSKFMHRLFGVKGVEVTEIIDDMPDKDTKLLHYREKNPTSGKDVDWSIVCCRRTKELLKSSILPPNKIKCNDNYFPSKPQSDKIKTIVTALMTTTKQSIAPQFENAERIDSDVIVGCVSWNVGEDARASMLASVPDDFRIKPFEGTKDFLDDNGCVSIRLASILGNAQQVIIEHSSDVISEPLSSA